MIAHLPKIFLNQISLNVDHFCDMGVDLDMDARNHLDLNSMRVAKPYRRFLNEMTLKVKILSTRVFHLDISARNHLECMRVMPRL